MRKEIVAKYIKEFTDWVNGKSILVGFPASMGDASKGILSWKQVISINDWTSLDVKYILDDHLVEFRKALAMGEQVQYNFSIKPNNCDAYPKYWQDVKPDIGIVSNAHVGQYRIKQEPKFKENDIVRVKCVDGKSTFIGKVTSVRELDLTLNKSSIAFISDCELWKPQHGDLCWFWNEYMKYPVLSKIYSINDGYKYITEKSENYPYCEPFLGSLPLAFRHLKQ